MRSWRHIEERLRTSALGLTGGCGDWYTTPVDMETSLHVIDY